MFSNFALPGVFKRVIGFRGVVRKTLVIGNSHSLDQLSEWMQDQRIHGFFVGSFSRRIKPRSEDLIWLGDSSKLGEYLDNHEVHPVVVIRENKKESWVIPIADLASKHGCRMLIYNTLSRLFDSRRFLLRNRPPILYTP